MNIYHVILKLKHRNSPNLYLHLVTLKTLYYWSLNVLSIINSRTILVPLFIILEKKIRKTFSPQY